MVSASVHIRLIACAVTGLILSLTRCVPCVDFSKSGSSRPSGCDVASHFFAALRAQSYPPTVGDDFPGCMAVHCACYKTVTVSAARVVFLQPADRPSVSFLKMCGYDRRHGTPHYYFSFGTQRTCIARIRNSSQAVPRIHGVPVFSRCGTVNSNRKSYFTKKK